jgi:putative SOS response-associated peptidase YedK
MPAILTSPEEALLWLSDKPWSAPIQNLIRTYEVDLEYYQVTPEVGKVGTQSAQYIEVS